MNNAYLLDLMISRVDFIVGSNFEKMLQRLDRMQISDYNR